MRKLRNLKEISEKIGLDSQYPFSHVKGNFDICARNTTKISCRTFKRKISILHNFPIMTAMIFEWCSDESHFHLLLNPDPLSWRLVDLSISKDRYVFQLIFRATESKQRTHCYIFQKALCCALASGTSLLLSAIPNATEQYLWRCFTIFD